MNANAEYLALRKICEQHGDPLKAPAMEKYMKHKFSYYGINSPKRKDLQKPFMKKWVKADRTFLKALVMLLFHDEHREMQYIACELLSRTKKKWEEEDLPFFQSLVLLKSWWDSVDALSPTIGDLFLRFPDLQPQTTDSWMQTDELWLKRVALIHQLKYRERVDWAMMQRYCLAIVGSKEFFLEKGAGWALRQYSKFRPDLVREFIANNELPRLTVHEGSKYT